MLQAFILNVSSECFKSKSDVASFSSLSAASPRCLLLLAPAGHPPLPPLFLNAGDVRGGTGPTWVRETAAGARGRPAASKPINLGIDLLW